MLVEVARKAYLASLVPVIVNAILNEHQIIADIVAFVNKGDFPRSRLGEKQRGKILGSWVSRKMRTMAQFSIRDADGGLADVNEGSEPRHSGAPSARNGSVIERSSLRNVESISDMPRDRKSSYTRYSPPPTPAGYVEMPAESNVTGNDDAGTDDTLNQAQSVARTAASLGPLNLDFSGRSDKHNSEYADSLRSPLSPPGGADFPDRQPSPLPPAPGPKPAGYMNHQTAEQNAGDLYTLPSQRQSLERPEISSSRPSTALRIANPSIESDEEWGKEALGYMRYAGQRNFN